MKKILLGLLLMAPIHADPVVEEVIYSNVQIADEFLEELESLGIFYYFDEEGRLHVITPYD